MTPARFALGILLGTSIAATGAIVMAALGLGGAADWPREAHAAGPAQAASADAGVTKVPVTVMVLHATNTDGGIDPQIGSLPELKKPPFSSYNTYKLIARNEIELTQAQPATTMLPNKRELRTALTGVLENNQRYRISTSISQPHQDAGTKRFLPLLEVTAKSGETFFVAGQSYQGGVLVVGIKVGK
jgi:hypothetical protein